MSKRGTVRNMTLRPMVDRYIRELAQERETSLANTLNIAIMETPGFTEWAFKDKYRELELEVERLSQLNDAMRTRMEELI
jgi:RNase P protein component